MTDTDFVRSYGQHVNRLLQRFDRDAALKEAIGGEFMAVGKLEYYLLCSLGIGEKSFVVDVGCGSGRLAAQLAAIPRLKYVGTDVVQELLDLASQIAQRPDWNFVKVNGLTIPVKAGVADVVSFFSVFTHLLHEDSFKYLREAHRVLKPGGVAVFSFLEFRIQCHWEIFEATVHNATPGHHLNQFMDRDAIQTWAQKLGFVVEGIYDGDRGHIPIPEEVKWDNGNRMIDFGNLGQSVAVLRKPIE